MTKEVAFLHLPTMMKEMFIALAKPLTHHQGVANPWTERPVTKEGLGGVRPDWAPPSVPRV